MAYSLKPLRVLLAKPRGFCAGVERAIEIVERAVDRHDAPVYVRHEIVHNHHVVEELRARGAVFVDELDQVPEGALTIFSAHGVSRKVEQHARERSLDVIDATCPLVEKVHKQGQRYAALGYDVVMIGHRGHAEVEGTTGQIDGHVHVIAKGEEVAGLNVRDPSRVAYITQTTLSVTDTRDVIVALQQRFPGIVGPDTRDICYATQNRQTAVRALAREAQLILVIGSATSSNSNRLREIGVALGVPSHLIERATMIDPEWLNDIETVGLTAGASAPEALVQEVIEWMKSCRTVSVETLDGIEENVRFRLPERLTESERLPAA